MPEAQWIEFKRLTERFENPISTKNRTRIYANKTDLKNGFKIDYVN